MNSVLVKDLTSRLSQADPNARVIIDGHADAYDEFDIEIISPTTQVKLKIDDAPDELPLAEQDEVVENCENAIHALESEVESGKENFSRIEELTAAVRTSFDSIKSKLPE